ncbi:unnamed protein product, partial [Nesidiocoris tenuis]
MGVYGGAGRHDEGVCLSQQVVLSPKVEPPPPPPPCARLVAAFHNSPTSPHTITITDSIIV